MAKPGRIEAEVKEESVKILLHLLKVIMYAYIDYLSYHTHTGVYTTLYLVIISIMAGY